MSTPARIARRNGPSNSTRSRDNASQSLEHIRSLLHNPSRQLYDLYRVGSMLATSIHPRGSYGAKWIARQAEYLERDKSFLHKLVKFAKLFDPDRMAQIEQAGLSWSHIEKVLRMKNTANAFEILMKAADQGLSVRELQIQLNRKEPLKPERPSRTPRTAEVHGLEVDLKVLMKQTDSFLHLYKGV